MAKGQMKSNREAKKPKKTEAEKLKAKSGVADIRNLTLPDKGQPRKS